MLERFPFVATLRLLWLTLTTRAKSAVAWHWRDHFDATERAVLVEWILSVIAGVEKLVAPYPFALHIHFHRHPADRPVSRAYTTRLRTRSIHFYVDPRYPLQNFLQDPTAAYELSLLLIPYIGWRYFWLAKGFASFMQYQVMRAMGTLSTEQLMARYREHIVEADRGYSYLAEPFASAAPKLHEQSKLPTMSWGAAVYFLQVDKALQAHDSSLPDILARYMKDNRHDEYPLAQLVAEFDRLAETQVFREQLDALHNQPGFPTYSNLL